MMDISGFCGSMTTPVEMSHKDPEPLRFTHMVDHPDAIL